MYSYFPLMLLSFIVSFQPFAYTNITATNNGAHKLDLTSVNISVGQISRTTAEPKLMCICDVALSCQTVHTGQVPPPTRRLRRTASWQAWVTDLLEHTSRLGQQSLGPSAFPAQCTCAGSLPDHARQPCSCLSLFSLWPLPQTQLLKRELAPAPTITTACAHAHTSTNRSGKCKAEPRRKKYVCPGLLFL